MDENQEGQDIFSGGTCPQAHPHFHPQKCHFQVPARLEKEGPFLLGGKAQWSVTSIITMATVPCKVSDFSLEVQPAPRSIK